MHVARAAIAQPPTVRASECLMSAAWEEGAGGSRSLRPPEGVQPRGLVHFLGGLLVSPKPDVAYRYVLESLSARGYAVVATPFAVDFDYRKPAAEIYERFALAKSALDAEYAELPQLAMGHSLGALMQVLLICEQSGYAEACAGAALISYNNKPASDAIPLFEQLFAPALTPLEPLTRLPAYGDAVVQAQQLRKAGFEALRDLVARDPLQLLQRAPIEASAHIDTCTHTHAHIDTCTHTHMHGHVRTHRHMHT